MLLWFALLVVALLAIVAIRRSRRVEEALDEVLSEVRKLDRVTEEREARLRQEIARLQTASLVSSGAPHFHEGMTVAEALELDARASEVMASFHIGGCSSCGIDPKDTLQQGAVANGVDVKELVDSLNALLVSR